MNAFDEDPIKRLINAATGSLNPASLWFLLTSVPEGKAVLKFDPQSVPRFHDWLRGETGNWPAPLRVGENLSETVFGDKLVFSPEPNGNPGPGHFCELYADGSCLLAVQAGNVKDATEAHGRLWAIGEGSIAWLSICLIRLAAGWAAQASVLGPASLDLRIFSASPEDQFDLQLWSFATGTNAPASNARQMTQPSQRLIDLKSCLSADATLVARSLLLPLLAQFGHDESRHIDATGAITSDNFVGHAPQIYAWAQAIGVACR